MCEVRRGSNCHSEEIPSQCWPKRCKCYFKSVCYPKSFTEIWLTASEMFLAMALARTSLMVNRAVLSSMMTTSSIEDFDRENFSDRNSVSNLYRKNNIRASEAMVYHLTRSDAYCWARLRAACGICGPVNENPSSYVSTAAASSLYVVRKSDATPKRSDIVRNS